MAITVKIEQETKKEISFPCLMRLKKTGLIVLFNSECTGMVINPDKIFPVGKYKEIWSFPTFSEEWEPSPPITLSNN